MTPCAIRVPAFFLDTLLKGLPRNQEGLVRSVGLLPDELVLESPGVRSAELPCEWLLRGEDESRSWPSDAP